MMKSAAAVIVPVTQQPPFNPPNDTNCERSVGSRAAQFSPRA